MWLPSRQVGSRPGRGLRHTGSARCQGQSGSSLGIGPRVNVVATCGPSEAQTLGQEQEAALNNVTGSR